MSRYSYGPAPQPRPRQGQREHDRRYDTWRWKQLRTRIKRRDPYCMVVPGCPERSTVADHIVPVHPGMPDSQFYDPANLRGACRQHNLDRGRMQRAAERLGEAGSFRGAETQHRPLDNLYTQKTPPRSTPGLIVDYDAE